MANISLTRVNQKLAQACALLDGVDVDTLTSVHHNSLKEAAAFHLVCAYQHYLREIAETYWLKNTANIHTEIDLMDAFYSAKKHPVEAEELIALRQSNNSWVGQLHRYYESLWAAPESSVLSSTDQPENDSIIKAVNIDSDFDISLVDISIILSWHKEFAALVKRHRETSAEF